MLKQLLFYSLFFFAETLLFSQSYVLSGKISDKNEALPFATILVNGTTIGTNSNINGLYTLKLPAGKYEIVYQYIGYSKKIEKVELNGDKLINVTLFNDGLTLKEVEIKAGENPANPIIRSAIRKRKYYHNQVKAYTCKAYIKGLQRITQLPKNFSKLIKISGGNASDTSDLKGVVYLSESESKYFFRKPDDEKEIMYSSKISGDNKSFSFNQLSDMKVNFYNNLVELGNLSDRPFISPINENAFLYYRYYLLGKITNEGKVINKIKIVPKNKTAACFNGIIYIQDSTWRITSVDFMLTKNAKIDFVDTLYLKQLHSPVQADTLWLPVTLNLGFNFKAFGIIGKGYFNANIKEYDLNPVFPKRFFKNEVLKVEEDANKKDTSYWNTNRAVPLTIEEINDYREKDSITKVRSSDRYIDSADKKNNRFEFRDLFLGYRYYNTKKKLSVSVPGIITNAVQYNTVEGLNLSYRFGISKSYEDNKQLYFGARSRYGFANKLWGGEMGSNFLFRPEKFSQIGILFKSIVEQYNQRNPVSQLINSIYTLFLNQNYLKLFKETAVEANYSTELINGIYFTTVVKYAERSPLINKSDQLIVDDKSKLFTSNNPLNSLSDNPAFVLNNAFTAELNFSFRFKQKYYTLPHQKIISGSKYPQLTLSFKKAMPVLNSVVNYNLLSTSVSDDVKLGLFGTFSFRVKGGAFLTSKKLFFMDYKHFLGNQTVMNTNDYLNSFRLLPYYSFSANKWYAEGHAEHHFNGFIINKLPLLKKLNVQEVVGAHFLASNQLDYYYELNFGIEKIFKVIRVDYILGYAANTALNQGVTVGLNFDF